MKQLYVLLLMMPLLAIGQSGKQNVEKPSGESASHAVFLEDYQKLNSFDEVLEKFAGRTVYIDLWATWCGPCVAEFAYKDGLHDIAAKHDIDILYLSMDQDKDDQKWQEFIQKHELSGYHMRANKALYKDIQAKFSREYQGRKAFGIPYYIIAKDGEVVLKQAPRPSAGELLYTELINYKN
ncbi:TlpA family protein disulfide reductase [Sphingobacterium sp. lm-10]|uniref:TlpA family protein disulfide reductase n=1 Tax=Sphingobacterium sp. lm-10 TaxID=2944904 RepID=UPI0020226160|nr:TlpA disulfide reductase family protein [Sphingobacterium sp. lm-10]MCL7986535.1 TlpA family protein disulfide reductase [Sphingobacterium sp. lm-10]